MVYEVRDFPYGVYQMHNPRLEPLPGLSLNLASTGRGSSVGRQMGRLPPGQFGALVVNLSAGSEGVWAKCSEVVHQRSWSLYINYNGIMKVSSAHVTAAS